MKDSTENIKRYVGPSVAHVRTVIHRRATDIPTDLKQKITLSFQYFHSIYI